MQQRAAGSLKSPEYDHIINMADVSMTKYLPSKKRTDIDLPLIKNEDWGLPLKEKLIHIIPVILIICIFILWYFSYPVHLVKQDGKIVNVERINISGNYTSDHAAILALAKPPMLNSKISAVDNETELAAAPLLHIALNLANAYKDQDRFIYLT